MSRGPASFKQRDVTRAIKGARAAGIDVSGVKVDKQGNIVILTGKPIESPDGGGSWDQAIAELESRQ
jgi:hypothetical protein